ncbi:MAG: ClpXP protease specificity-enhancing factor [Gammaproteobacteria bacterium]|nr:ClpXP protease specificity-enhancing factor [Gammaproteobacteria bacterium]MDD9869549.1 ClpXP protease specificity-enhancing factor [Gammaproteobacteria bacterium]MDD9886721.1 ClpXP protease specificity-enhancing factor [Gammaproteobacteria bacterium]
MTSRRPYLFRAIHQWIVDNGCTPHIVFNLLHPGVRMPPGHDRNNLVTLNISADAVRDFVMDDEAVSFSARFGGRAEMVVVPLDAVLMIYARENMQGMMLSDKAPSSGAQPPAAQPPQPQSPARQSSAPAPKKRPGGPNLKLVE